MKCPRVYNCCRYLFVVVLLWLGAAHAGVAQQTDTAQPSRELQEQRELQPYHSERTTTTHIRTPSSGTYGVPEPKQHYRHPFMGQKYLNVAVKAYQEQLKEDQGGALLRFLDKIAPFILNKFQFGVYRIYDMPIIERGKPLQEPQMDSKTQRQKELESDKHVLTKPGEEKP